MALLPCFSGISVREFGTANSWHKFCIQFVVDEIALSTVASKPFGKVYL
jgi:hypothetical protein